MPEVFFNGPAGRIEGRYTESTDMRAPIALVLHPNPAQGGTMNNKVAYAAYKALAGKGFTVLRINFRGVGRSQGEFDNGVGELTDAATALDWLQLHNPMSSATLVAGFSFGAWITMQMIMRRPEINKFIAISPPANKYDFSFLSPCPISGLIVQGDMDSIVPEEDARELHNKISKQRNIKIDYKLITGADHFFRDKISGLESCIAEYLDEAFPMSDNALASSNTNKPQSKDDTKVQRVFLD